MKTFSPASLRLACPVSPGVSRLPTGGHPSASGAYWPVPVGNSARRQFLRLQNTEKPVKNYPVQDQKTSLPTGTIRPLVAGSNCRKLPTWMKAHQNDPNKLLIGVIDFELDIRKIGRRLKALKLMREEYVAYQASLKRRSRNKVTRKPSALD